MVSQTCNFSLEERWVCKGILYRYRIKKNQSSRKRQSKENNRKGCVLFVWKFKSNCLTTTCHEITMLLVQKGGRAVSRKRNRF